MGRHHANGYVTYPQLVHNSGTARMTRFKSQVLRKPTGPTPIVRIALGAVLALVIAVAALGTTTVPPDPVTPALVATVAAAPPVTLEAPVAPMVEPPVLTPAVPTVVASRKSKGRECR